MKGFLAAELNVLFIFLGFAFLMYSFVVLAKQNADSTLQFLKDEFHLILLFVAVIVVLGVLVHMVHDAADSTGLSSIEHALDTLIGAFVGLLTGAKLYQRKGDADKPKDQP